ncbi:hypothetical protein HJG60_010657 [Phyllostomus discolor]|uniref:Uncharacterized protein n=1 Tax=Phyllostomus discolor TaxID=89673 RepID=A0A834AHD8_9CHIR|nr:hypothetical protein HJG60_010657 [Phyllostomus discolor]
MKDNNPRKCFHNVGDGEVVAFDAVEGERDAEATSVAAPGGVPVQGGKYAADGEHYGVICVVGVLQAVTNRITRIVRAGEKECGIGSQRPGPTLQPYCRQLLPPHYMPTPCGHQPRYYNPPVQGEVMEGADN